MSYSSIWWEFKSWPQFLPICPDAALVGSDLKNVNTHLVAAAASPVLENSGELLRSRLHQEGEAQA